MVLLLTPLAALAQQQAPMTQEQAIMMEFAQATVMQTMCLVHYESTGEEEKASTYSFAPFVHAEEHGIPKEFVLGVVSEIYPEIKANVDTFPEDMSVLCDSNYENIKVLVDAWLERQAPQPEPEAETEPAVDYTIPGAVVI